MCVVLCELTVSVRITAISVEVTVVDEDDNDAVLGGDIDSGGGSAPLVSTCITGGLGGGLGGCIVKSKQPRSDDALVERALSTQAREDDVKHVSSDKSDTTLGVRRCRGLRRWYTV